MSRPPAPHPALRFGAQAQVACAHHVIGGGLCEAVHGHTYTVEALARGPRTDGRDLDLEGMGKALRDCLWAYDHRDLNEIFEMPTCEVFCRAIFDDLKQALPGLCGVRVWEGEGKWAETGAVQELSAQPGPS